MSEAGWYIDLVLVVCRKQNACPFSKMRRAEPDVYCDIERLAFNKTAQFSLRMAQLIVQTPKRALRRAGVIVLNEGIPDRELGEFGTMIGFRKKPSRVTENLGAQFANAR